MNDKTEIQKSDSSLSEGSDQNGQDQLEPDSAKKRPEKKPMVQVLKEFTHRISDIQETLGALRHTIDKRNEQIQELKKDFLPIEELTEDIPRETYVALLRDARSLIRKIERIKNSKVPIVLLNSTFIYLTSIWDKLLTEMVRAAFQIKPELYKSLDATLYFSEVAEFESFEEVKTHILDKWIESLRRESISEQFDVLQKRFSCPLTKFDKYPDLVEIFQRRNLIVHCDGVVSQQYLNECKKAEFDTGELSAGDSTRIDPQYLLMATSTLILVGTMLVQTIWRKIADEDLKDQDTHLNSVIYSRLQEKDFALAVELSNFMLRLPRISSDLDRRICLINKCIALKNLEEEKTLQQVLDDHDWTATLPEFALARQVLLHDFEAAARTMLAIGKEGELLTELSYHEWPLFNEFRESMEFAGAYEEIYGYQYVVEVKREAREKAADLDPQTLGENEAESEC